MRAIRISVNNSKRTFSSRFYVIRLMQVSYRIKNNTYTYLYQPVEPMRIIHIFIVRVAKANIFAVGNLYGYVKRI